MKRLVMIVLLLFVMAAPARCNDCRTVCDNVRGVQNCYPSCIDEDAVR